MHGFSIMKIGNIDVLLPLQVQHSGSVFFLHCSMNAFFQLFWKDRPTMTVEAITCIEHIKTTIHKNSQRLSHKHIRIMAYINVKFHQNMFAMYIHFRNQVPTDLLGIWPALTAMWFKAPPLTARCLSPLPGFDPGLDMCEGCQ